MSFSIGVAPRLPLPTWGEIRRGLRDDRVAITRWGADTPVRDDERPAMAAYHAVRGSSDARLTLSLAVLPNDPSVTTPEAWLDEWEGHVPDPEERTESWRRAGYYLLLESNVGRPEGEIEVMADLTAAAAAAVDGLILLQDGDYFDVENGVYTAEEFRAALDTSKSDTSSVEGGASAPASPRPELIARPDPSHLHRDPEPFDVYGELARLPRNDPDAAVALYERAVLAGVDFKGITNTLARRQDVRGGITQRLAAVLRKHGRVPR